MSTLEYAASADERRSLSGMGKALSPAVRRLTVVSVTIMFLATGCAPRDRSAESQIPDNQPDVVLCQGIEVPVQALKNPRPASELAPDAAPALGGRDVSNFDPVGWLIAEESSDRVMLMNKLAVPEDNGWGDVREYEYIVISTDVPEEPGKSGWALVGASTCTPTLDLGELSVGAVSLDSSLPPAPDSDRLALLVTEFACNSGQSAEGRVELVKLTETESTVEIVLGVRASGLGGSCQSNPATPVTVDLERPLGDRTVLNAAVMPAREIIAATFP
ncbi:hypothetical protein [Arthrobacter sp.]|uniref:hypothetical protein n=1 Tax=Arthrobacter sp. TaxID=1667 RepID=UPI00281219C5|nr:hypothetical protein [Arthrobacter sp.]